MARIVIIIPTYNERANTARMIDALAGVVASIPRHELCVLYVDGQSPDGTAELVREKQQRFPWLHLLVEEKKEGLGMAYAKGMRYAMEELGADYLMEFDGDFQHRPADIPRLIAEIDNGYDYIIGSRYVPGGSVPANWGFKRKLLSRGGSLLARTILVLPRIHDVTGGFKLARVKGFMDAFDFGTLLSKSFAYKVHLLFYMAKRGARVKEVPIVFEARTAGDSKIARNEMQETLRVIALLQFRRLWRQRV
jgi:dolichol-phosphate mannosyltransferase